MLVLTGARKVELKAFYDEFFGRQDVCVAIVRAVYAMMLNTPRHTAARAHITTRAALCNARLCDLSEYGKRGFTHEELVYLAVWGMTEPGVISWKEFGRPIKMRVVQIHASGAMDITW